ncbi:MAG: UDP-N-acetylglucosamine 2-epimerase [Burkholderiales bacterium]|nr:UDP-N-acetylglucosamine 2-epimerase [Burkholderiales bacterium]
MYESHFGITGPPFQLTPDPSFYFDSRGHHRALVEFRRGLAEGSGFVVVSGEIGAGKTTLVRTLLAELDPTSVAVAQVLSTQLQADELLGAILFAFGITGDHDPSSDLASSVRQFLVSLARERRRAVLIVDEAQNLHQAAFEQLGALITPDSEEEAALQICLVGQPELREIVASQSLRHLSERVVVSCHLGPIDQAETGSYIEHRLRKVGWVGNPSFDAAAFDEIFRWTQGVPRKINLLCNRLMLSRFLTQQTRIDADAVAQTARDLRVEIGEADSTVERAAEALEVERPADTASPVVEHSRPPEPHPARQQGPLLCVMGGHSDHIKMAPLLNAMAGRADLPAAKIVRVYRNNALELNHDLFNGLAGGSSVVNLDVTGGTYAEQAAELMKKFEFVIDHSQPRAVIVIDGSDAALACGLVARRKDLPVAHIGAGLRAREGSAATDMTRKLTDDLADVLYTCEVEAAATLAAEGVAASRIQCVGTLLIDSLQAALRKLIASPPAGIPAGMPTSFVADRNGYALVVLNKRVNVGESQNLSELVSILKDVSRDVPLIWPVHVRVEEQLKKLRLDTLIARERIACIPVQAYAPYVELLRNATCVLTDSWNLQEEASAMGIPCLMMGLYPQRMETPAIGGTVAVGNSRALATRAVWDCLFNGGKRGQIPTLWDGKAAERIAGHLAEWLPHVKSAVHAST